MMAGNGHQPGTDLGTRRVIGLRSAPGVNEDIQRDFLCDRTITHHGKCYAEHQPVIAVVQSLHSKLLTVGHISNEKRVFDAVGFHSPSSNVPVKTLISQDSEAGWDRVAGSRLPDRYR